jgi:hypothetical protein
VQDVGGQGPGHRHLGQLEHDVAAVAHDPGTDLDQPLAQRRERPMLDRLGQRQRLVSGGRALSARPLDDEVLAHLLHRQDCERGRRSEALIIVEQASVIKQARRVLQYRFQSWRERGTPDGNGLVLLKFKAYAKRGRDAYVNIKPTYYHIRIVLIGVAKVGGSLKEG